MNGKIIKRLKCNEKPFGLNSKEERDVFVQIGVKSCLVLNYYNEWQDTESFLNFKTYRIKPNYQLDKAKHLYSKVFKVYNCLVVKLPYDLAGYSNRGSVRSIDSLSRLIDFRGFRSADDSVTMLEDVATLVAAGYTIRAKFEISNRF
jgi:hypothetical protein